MPQKNEKRQVAVADKVPPQINRYYLKVSRRYMVLGIAAMLALFLYIIAVMMFLGEYVTYENLKYLARDFEAMSLPGSDEFTQIVYTGNDGTRFEYFRGGIALTDGDSFSYYDASGISLIDEELRYSEPALEAGEKYLLAYDIGGVGFSVFNQLTRIIERETEQPIIAGDIAEDGSMVIATRSRETRYVVDVYNAAFRKTMSIYKENYVLDTAISPDGEYIVIASAVAGDTAFDCEVEICERGHGEHIFLTKFANSIPLELYAHENGFVLMCDKGAYFFDYSGGTSATVPFYGMSLRHADINERGAVFCGSVNALGSENRVIVTSLAGEILYDGVISERISDVYASREADALLYYTAADSVVKLYADGERVTESVPTGELLSVIPEKDGAVLCSRSGAEHRKFEKNKS